LRRDRTCRGCCCDDNSNHVRLCAPPHAYTLWIVVSDRGADMRGGTPEFRTWIQSSSGRGSGDHRDDVDPEIIGTWIRGSSGWCGSGDHRDVDPVFEDLGFMRYPRSQGPSHGLGLFFPNFFFFLFSFFPVHISIVNLWLVIALN
jgi:hypothetical protein